MNTEPASREDGATDFFLEEEDEEVEVELEDRRLRSAMVDPNQLSPKRPKYLTKAKPLLLTAKI
jgi:hypothetical protein